MSSYLIIGRTPFRNKDVILHLLSEKGFSSVVVKNGQTLKNPFGRATDYLNLVSIKTSYTTKLTYLADIKVIRRYSFVPGNYQKIKAASRIINIINLCRNNLEDYFNLFYVVTKVLELMETKKHYDLVFLIKFTYFIGLALSAYEGDEDPFLLPIIKQIYTDKTFNYIIDDNLAPTIEDFLQKYYQTYLAITIK